ncbi:MAG TPA: hypothetical protein VIO64_16060 [Pseudobacteroides sp.]|uniref:hypothetical protein n=1 Tax=Pseudobacteroides sp. TaxID=1968840 RepID=UPI002F937A48
MDLITLIICVFINKYITEELFEEWVYENDSLEEFLGKKAYLEVIGTRFNDMIEIASLRLFLKNYLFTEKQFDCSNIHDAFCEKWANERNCEAFGNGYLCSEKKIIDILFKEFRYPEVTDYTTIDLREVKTEEQLLESLSKGLGFYRFPMHWNWFDEYLVYSNTPKIVTIKGIDNIRTNFYECYHFIIDTFERLKIKKDNLLIYFE